MADGEAEGGGGWEYPESDAREQGRIITRRAGAGVIMVCIDISA